MLKKLGRENFKKGEVNAMLNYEQKINQELHNLKHTQGIVVNSMSELQTAWKTNYPPKEIDWNKQEFNGLINTGEFESSADKIREIIRKQNEFLQYSHIMLNMEKFKKLSVEDFLLLQKIFNMTDEEYISFKLHIKFNPRDFSENIKGIIDADKSIKYKVRINGKGE